MIIRIREWVESFGDNFDQWFEIYNKNNMLELKIKTLESRKENLFIVSYGDFIIRGVNGEYYACKPDIFEKSYDLVDYRTAIGGSSISVSTPMNERT
jgi:hypothetical protein